MTSTLDRNALRIELWGVINRYPASFYEYAVRIGISQHTLLAFLNEKKKPTRLTLSKINVYLAPSRD